MVQLEVDGGEEELAQHLRPGAIRPRGEQLPIELVGQRLPGVDVPAQTEQRLAVIAPVLHELARQLDRIPLDVADARRESLLDRRQHVLEAVTELVKERVDLVEAHQRGPAPHRRRLIADEVRHRQPSDAPPDALVHPRPAALLGGPAVRIEVERGDGRAARVGDAEEAHVGMPDRRLAVGGGDAHAEQPTGEREQAVEDARQREVRAQRLVAVVVALFAQALRPERRPSSAATAPRAHRDRRRASPDRPCRARRHQTMRCAALRAAARPTRRRAPSCSRGSPPRTSEPEEARLLATELQDATDERPVVALAALRG